MIVIFALLTVDVNFTYCPILNVLSSPDANLKKMASFHVPKILIWSLQLKLFDIALK